MYLIIGLGNPGLKYNSTRHNAGKLVIKKISPKLKTNKKLSSKLTKSDNVIYATPQTYMNESGRAIQALASFYKIKPENIIIICDDIDLPLGKIRIRKKGSAGGHNGLKSIISHLNSQNFPRVRIGIGPQPDNVPSEKYVLQKFKKEEKQTLETDIIPRAIEAIQTILTSGAQEAMNKYN
ncbi:aminoacyl-tRNA hydrolase [Candidatus Falkowbacteria bacterium]|nr:aminoacyl-tRNA hydrolase [Candidatus Falkowbacteria bacterium]